MGDAVHKATINPGLGGDLAIEGIAHFTNILLPYSKRTRCRLSNSWPVHSRSITHTSDCGPTRS
ncbi:hypothetical protein BDV09DRAFT_200019 [Aspergillus tetrazonus]